MNEVLSTMDNMGRIRDNNGKLIGFYDHGNNVLHVDGYVQTFPAKDFETAHSLFGDLYIGGSK